MSKNKADPEPLEQESQGPKLSSIEKKMQEIYESVIQESELREIVTHSIGVCTKKYVSQIVDDKDFFTIEADEVDLKPLIRKWRGTFMKDEIKNYAMNHLYVSDTSMGKKDLQRNLKLLNDNIDVMGTTDGFERIEKQIGLSDKLMKKNSTISALKPMKDMEPFLGRHETYEEKKAKIDAEMNLKAAQTNELMNKLREEKKQRRDEIRKIKAQRKINKNKNDEKRLKRLEEEEKQKQIELEKRQKEVEEKVKKIEEERKKKIEIMNENTKKIEPPMYRNIQKSYSKNVLMPSLEQKKKALASIRDLHRPIQIEEILEHKKKIDEIIEKKRKEHDENMPKDDFTYKKYETNWIQQVKEQETQAREEQEKKEGEKRELYEKMRSYGDMVKEMHWPTVSKKKQLEMKLLRQSLKHPLKPNLNGSALSSHANGNRRSTDSLLGYGKPGAQSDIEEEHSNTIKRRKIIWKENTMIPKPKPQKEVKVQDWLQDRRKNREEEGRDGARTSPIRHWQKEIDGAHLNQQEKYEFIKERTKQLEEEAKRKEKIITIAQGGTMEDRDQINEMIFESIKAKLNILEEFNS